jgi:hypothetical protein
MGRMAVPWLNRSVSVLGQRVPVVVVALVSTVIGASILAAVAGRAGIPVLAFGVLLPDRVLFGYEVWRLATWALFGRDLNLLFGCYALWWVGADLARAWGGGRFLRVCLAIVVLAAAATCLLSLVWKGLQGEVYLGVWPLANALLIAWASLTPNGIVNLFMILPVPSRSVPAVIVGMTVIAALLEGVGGYIPHLIAEGLIVLYLRDFTIRNLWLRMRYANIERSLRRRSSPLREVKRGGETPPRWFH